METEEGGSTAASAAAAAAAGGNRPFAMKFSLSRPKRPSIHSHGQIGKHNDPQDAEIEYVSGVDAQSFVLTNPRSKPEPKVIPMMENTWRPEKRMKNLMVETLDLDEDRFVLETLTAGPKEGVRYGLSFRENKVDLDSVEGFESDEKMADAREAGPSVKEKTFERKDETGKSEKRRDSRSKDHGRSPDRMEKERHSGRHGSKDSRKADHVTEDHAKRSKETHDRMR